ncbi:hypothetical protein Taro_040185 [Colocasia esculenta]|uniref:Response regulatory domain-containing protein n=1 Tax=Colocasia esculenta TaxID=4460 RepID=A0A843W8B6_COLES|nr:hypothetical protein [Colocasia esculenta]
MESVDGRGKDGLVGGSDGRGPGRVRVLVVDDSPVDRRIVERLLMISGNLFDVVSVDGGKKALELLGLNGPQDDSHNYDDPNVDIILTDYCMPEMNGYELLKAVKEHNHGSSIPVVIMSSENDPQRISRCRACGAEDFILKPLQTVDIEQLRNYARPPDLSATKTSGKRKPSRDIITDSNDSERHPRPRLAGVAVA